MPAARHKRLEPCCPGFAGQEGTVCYGPDCVHCWLQEAIKKMIAKWQEPAPAKQTRVLPVPDMEPKKRRGGRRYASHFASCDSCGPCGLAQVDKAAHSCLWGKAGGKGDQTSVAVAARADCLALWKQGKRRRRTGIASGTLAAVHGSSCFAWWKPAQVCCWARMQHARWDCVPRSNLLSATSLCNTAREPCSSLASQQGPL